MPIPPTTQLAVGMILRWDGALNTQYKIVDQTPGNIHNWFMVQGTWTMAGMQFPEQGTGENWHIDDIRDNFSIIEQ